mmetsp:Transcript_86647/g.240250  ORF Transcript_86647/g.240250 Transcript_86647/m.240250 type:complete len:415 (-) Transcript_86647:104-1348(-)
MGLQVLPQQRLPRARRRKATFCRASQSGGEEWRCAWAHGGAQSGNAGGECIPGGVEVPEKEGDSAVVALITESNLRCCMQNLALGVQAWDSGGFGLVRRLQSAERNHGTVEEMWQRDGTGGGRAVAVKRMPMRWVATDPEVFQAEHPKESERPWYDFGLLKMLNDLKFPYVCKLLGLFRDTDFTYVVMSLATKGDLFTWCLQAPEPGLKREVLMHPIVIQLFSAMGWLHDVGVAHRDLSLENILLTENCDGRTQVMIIDYGAATLSRSCMAEVRGKPAYQAPEMHEEVPYDPCLSDGFSLGVVLYGLAARDYPWTSTRASTCRLFECARTCGVRRFLQRRALQGGVAPEGTRVADVLSPGLSELLEGLLEVAPKRRLTLGEAHLEAGGRRSAWDLPWLTTVLDGQRGIGRHGGA